MPKELAKPFLEQAKRTRKEMLVYAVFATLAIKLGATRLAK